MLNLFRLFLFIISLALQFGLHSQAQAAQNCSDVLEKFAALFSKNETAASPPSQVEFRSPLVTSIDSTEGARAAVARFFSDNPVLSLEKNWKRTKKWIVGNTIYRIFKSNTGVEITVAFEMAEGGSSRREMDPNDARKTSTPPKKLVPPDLFLFAIDHAGMSADQDGGVSVVIIARKLFEEENGVSDYMEPEDRDALEPVLKRLKIEERMSNEFQVKSKKVSADEIKAKLIELGLTYSSELQDVVNEWAR